MSSRSTGRYFINVPLQRRALETTPLQLGGTYKTKFGLCSRLLCAVDAHFRFVHPSGYGTNRRCQQPPVLTIAASNLFSTSSQSHDRIVIINNFDLNRDNLAVKQKIKKRAEKQKIQSAHGS